ncbi:hypothetical protein VTP01DRAFT_3129 [Rhizomucor pusillus]|uniref:uncharacterized protein n=1 Tax=Rhizomucor pusillus TaxID=4840 RepID=UPI00374215C5
MPSDIPTYDASLDTNQHNVFESREHWECLDSIPTKIDQIDQKVQKNQEQKKGATPSSNNLYCTACKKKFSNEATWQNHLKSSKHIANEKKKGKQPSSKAPSAEPKSDVADPRIDEITKQLDKVLQSPSSEQKHQELWSISKSFFELKRPRDTSIVLQHLIQSATGDLQYQALLTLGRLYYIYKSFVPAYQQFLNALEQFWKIKSDSLLDIAKNFKSKNVEQLVDECRTCVSQSPSTGTNGNKIFVEMADIFSSTPSVDWFENAPTNGISIVLLLMASILDQTAGHSSQECLRQVSKKYKELNCPHRASETLMVLYKNESIQSDIFEALLLALEIGDLVRAKRITSAIVSSSSPIPAGLQFLVNITAAKGNLDHIQLETSLGDELDYILLLLEQGRSDLILAAATQDSVTQSEIIGRLSALLITETSH